MMLVMSTGDMTLPAASSLHSASIISGVMYASEKSDHCWKLWSFDSKMCPTIGATVVVGFYAVRNEMN